MKKRSILISIFSGILALFAFGLVACNNTDIDDGKYAVTFYEYRGAESTIVRVEADSKVEKPAEDPTREGYIFNGWCSDKRGKNTFDFENTTIDGDTIIYASWKNANVTITYEYNYKGGPSVETEIPVDTSAKQPEDPVRDNFNFMGWYTDTTYTQAFDFSSTITEDIYVYAKWQQYAATITFDLNYEGADNVDPQILILSAGVKVNEPIVPVRGEEGDYSFDGWYTGKGKKEKLYDFNSEVIGDVELHAKWTKLRSTVTYNGNYDDAELVYEKVAIGEKALGEAPKARTGYTFGGWYFDSACTIAYDFSANAIDSDVTVYAKWNAERRTITYNFNYTGAPEALVVDTYYDAIAEEPAEPTRVGDTFIGWFTDATQQNEYIFGNAVTDNLTLYAGWESQTSSSSDKDQPNGNGKWEITYYLNDGTGGIYEYRGKSVEEVGNAKYSAMRTDGVSYPERSGYMAVGWYTDPECTEEFDFANTRIRKNYSLYIKWMKEYVFEAEYTQFTNIGPDKEEKPGQGESNNPKGTNLIEWDQYEAGASGDYYVSYLFYEGAYLEFHIDAKEAVDDAVLVLRASVDLYDMYFKTGVDTGDKDGYGIYVNGTRYSFDYDLTGAIAPPPHGTGYTDKRAFEDYVISLKVSLQAGENIIMLVTENDRFFYGTMAASAPMVDCVKIYANAELTWTEGYNFQAENEEAIKGRWEGDRLS